MEERIRKNKQRRFFIGGLLVLLVAAFVLFFKFNGARNDVSIFISPYFDVNWEQIEYYDANLHTHTTLSDGKAEPAEVIDAYLNSGYKILAITDHDNQTECKTTWPWADFNRAPEDLGMIAVEGNEISNPDHIGSLFNNYGGGALTEEEALVAIQEKDGLAMFFHPGRYEQDINWYVDFYRRFPNLIGLEIYNRNDRYPGDRELWDNILYELMPARPVWGFANDDMHDLEKDYAWNRNVFLLEEFTPAALRSAIEKGEFYIYRPTAQGTQPDFAVNNILVGQDFIEISVDGDYERIDWLSFDPATGESRIIYSGTRITRAEIPAGSRFVRAEIVGVAGIIYTQPFGFKPLDF